MGLITNLKSGLPVLMLMLPFVSSSQYADTQLGRDGLNGPVKTAKITSYTVEITNDEENRGVSSNYQIRSYSESGKLEKISDHNADGSVIRTQEYNFGKGGNLSEWIDRMGENIINREVYTYDKAGNLIEKITLNEVGSIDRKITNSYDKKNQLIQTSAYSNSSEELVLNDTKRFEFDTEGNKIKESYRSPEGDNRGSEEWKYNNKGNVIDWLTLTDSGEIEVRHTYVYNEQNTLLARKSFDSNEILIAEVIFNEFGQPLNLIRYDSDGSISRKAGFEYDQFGNRTAELSYDPDGTKNVDVEYRYAYDNKDNWIEQIAYEGGQAAYIIGRDITYY